VDIGQKIKTENDYYEQAMASATGRIVDLWKDEQPFKFDQEARQFVDSNLNMTAQKIGPKLVALMDSMMRTWAKRDTAYELLLADTQKTLRSNRKKLELERSKINTLRNNFRVLSIARNDKEMLELSIAFMQEVKSKYDEIKDSSASAASAAKEGVEQ
jgi:hypothetical protein